MKDVLGALGPTRTSGKHVDLPASTEDSDILHFWRHKAQTSCHGTGTCKMGTDIQSEEACVDRNFRVHGVGKLRVADLSVLPFTPR